MEKDAPPTVLLLLPVRIKVRGVKVPSPTYPSPSVGEGMKGRKGVSAANRGVGAPVLVKLAVRRVVWVALALSPVDTVPVGVGAEASYTYPTSQS